MIIHRRLAIILAATLVASPAVHSQDDEKKPDRFSAGTFAGLKLRSIGPALTSGRIGDFAVDPTDPSRYFIAVASGGVWLTENAGVTWRPVFDSQGSYSIGCVVIDPNNTDVVWVGTGENNSQRSVSYGDGVYKSTDGGRTWKNVGLKDSEHIGKILIHPEDSDTVYVAAQGPLWKEGGDRGLYKTIDGGKSWEKILDIDEHTGVSDLVMCPTDPDTMLASAYQRRRRAWTLLNGGPSSGIHKTTDGGKTWKKITAGLPGVDKGRIGLAFAPTEPDVAYALVEAAEAQGGIFRSENRGETWSKKNSFDEQGQYYGEVVCDPFDADRIYLPNTYTMVSDDGGENLGRLGEADKHVDTHAFWVNPDDPEHYRSGCDGGVYESFDRGQNWRFLHNLPITQFYDITVSQDGPFYHAYGGTQDNFTLGGPARTRSSHGIANEDWFVTQGGDGFQVRVDPSNPDLVYCESQYGGLVRFNKKTGERVSIRPQPAPDDPPLRWNWDSALILSPHNPNRVYFAAQMVFRSDDRGNSWSKISGDLSRQVNRDELKVMGKYWGMDAVAKHLSTSPFGSVVSLSESPKKEGLIYAGTDDGLIQVTEDGGQNWRKVDIAEAPEYAKVARLFASRHDANTVYAVFDDHRNGNFKPYLFKSTDAGKSWASINGDLPERGSTLAFEEDVQNPNLLFAGTEFGLYFTIDGGKKWLQLKGGLPTIAVADLTIQETETDLAVGTFGRGIYILDDYTPLRAITPEMLEKESLLLPPRRALLYTETRRLGGGGRAFQGASFFLADNPPMGPTFTYFADKDLPKSLKAQRQEAEKKAIAEGKVPPIPTDAELRAEAEEEKPAIVLLISDSDGNLLRTQTVPAGKNLNRVTWDMGTERDRVTVPPGKYSARLAKRVTGLVEPFGDPVEFEIVEYLLDGEEPKDHKARYEYETKLSELLRAVSAASSVAGDLPGEIEALRDAADSTAGVDQKLRQQARDLLEEAREIDRTFNGDRVPGRYNRLTTPSVRSRAFSANPSGLSPPTQTQREAYQLVEKQLGELLPKLRALKEQKVKELEDALAAAGVAVPGRLPNWKSAKEQ